MDNRGKNPVSTIMDLCDTPSKTATDQLSELVLQLQSRIKSLDLVVSIHSARLDELEAKAGVEV